MYMKPQLLKHVSHVQICNSKCYPRKVRMETYHRIRGPKDIEVITTCASSNIKRRCRRTRKTAVYFQGTRFEQNVDVGYCDGPCGEGPSSTLHVCR